MIRESETLDSGLALVRVLQLASPALPIGAYSYSQGLEAVVTEGLVRDERGASRWIGEMLEGLIAPGEAAILWRLLIVIQRADWNACEAWNARFRASRETAELRAETEQMGSSLAKLALDLSLLDAQARAMLPRLAPITLPAAFALTACGFAVPATAALTAYLWSWLENQVLAAIKTVPLGQVAGQRLLTELGARIPAAAALARTIGDDDLNTFAPGLALASCRHETQYTRLFRS
ncbi:MAG TPA: urease accessory UreF family protein [Casimicrobiaceae bacterium]|nr:urease accessory UreF family protein [Casimicrobiaceae bacterium]